MPKNVIRGLSLLGAMLPVLTQAASLDVTVEIPAIASPKYRKPYLAVWIETFSQEPVADLAVWYKIAAPNNKGKQWLSDLKQWWKHRGYQTEIKADGVAGATRGPGVYRLHVDGDYPALQQLPPGKYYLSVESAREEGKNDVRHEQRLISFTWPPEKAETRQSQGKEELGPISLQLTP